MRYPAPKGRSPRLLTFLLLRQLRHRLLPKLPRGTAAAADASFIAMLFDEAHSSLVVVSDSMRIGDVDYVTTDIVAHLGPSPGHTVTLNASCGAARAGPAGTTSLSRSIPRPERRRVDFLLAHCDDCGAFHDDDLTVVLCVEGCRRLPRARSSTLPLQSRNLHIDRKCHHAPIS